MSGVQRPIPPRSSLVQRSVLNPDSRPSQIPLLIAFLVVGNILLHLFVWEDPTSLSLEERLDVSNPVMATFLITSLINLMLLPSLAFLVVMVATRNNSFSQNPEDFNTGAQNVSPSNQDADPDQQRAQNLHRNALENIPLAVLLSLLMILVGPNETAAITYMRVYTVSRLCHTLWYWNAGSHEIRAVLFKTGVFCNVGCAMQILKVMRKF